MIKHIVFTFLMVSMITFMTSCCCGDEFQKGWDSGVDIEEANELYVNGKYKEAIEKYEDSINKSSSAEAYYKIGLSYEKLENQEKALNYFKKAADWIEINPNSVDEFMLPDLKEKMVLLELLWVKL